MSESHPRPDRSLSTQLLVELVINPLDPGYDAAAARRRGAPAAPRRLDQVAVALGCLLVGFILVVAYVHTHRSAPQAAKDHDQLVSRVRAAQRDDAGLAAQAQQLAGRLDQLRAQAGLGSLGGQLSKEQLAAGAVAVTGPGLEVTLTEAAAATSTSTPTAGRVGTVPVGATNILTDRDVRSVVNELWADGAEAIAVNGVRLTPTSAIRFAGEAVLVDFQPITSPYVVRAIGPADELDTSFAASSVASRYHTLASADGIGFTFTQRSSLSLPATAAPAPRYASPAPTASASPR